LAASNPPFFGQYKYFKGAIGVDLAVTPVFADYSAKVENYVFDLYSALVYAQATQVSSPPAADVPGPLPALGAAAAFGYSRKLRTRINRSAKIGSGTDCL
jgi:hypothetical protein